MVFVMEKANKTGLMALNMLVTGSEIKPTDMELFTMQMETSMKGSGVKTKQTEKVSTIMQMEPIIMVSGKKTNNMDLVLNVGLMEPFMKDFIKMERKMVEESSHSLTVQFTRAISL